VLLYKLPECIERPYNSTLSTQGEIRVYGIFEANRRVQTDFFYNLDKATSYDSVLCYHAAVKSNGLTAKLERRILDLALEVKYSGPCSVWNKLLTYPRHLLLVSNNVS